MFQLLEKRDRANECVNSAAHETKHGARKDTQFIRGKFLFTQKLPDLTPYREVEYEGPG